jgi:uncharacterized protein YoxC
VELLLTILSVLAALSFLFLLVVGLLLIYKPLEGIRGTMESITMGVRAIEKQTVPLHSHAVGLVETVDKASVTLADTAVWLAQLNKDLPEALPGSSEWTEGG